MFTGLRRHKSMIPYTVKAVMQLLRADGSVATNKKLMREVGPIEAILYGELFSRCAYFEERGRLTKDGFFYNTVEDMQKDTGLTRKLQKPAIDKLVNMGLIEMEIRGIPAKRHFRFTYDNMENLFHLLNREEEAGRKAQLRQIGRTFIDSCRNIGADPDVTPELEEDIGRQIEEARAKEKKKKKWAYAEVE